MSDEISDSLDGDQAEDIKRWLTIGNSVVLVLVLLMTTLSMFLVFALRDEAAALTDQVRKSTKAAKAMQDELAALKERFQAPAPIAASANGVAEAKPTNIDAADPARDCVIRPGDKDGLARCLK